MKKLFSVMMLLFLVVGLTACSDKGKDKPAEKKQIVVGFSQVGAESDWRTANTDSMKKTFTEANGFKLIFDDAQQKQENQITAIRNFINQEVDYIVLAPVTETGWDTVLKEAKDKKIPVIIVDRQVDVSDKDLFTAWVGSDFKAEGVKAVKWMEEKLGTDKLNIVHLQGTIGSSAQIGRSGALSDAAKKNANWNLVAQQSGEFTQAKGQEVTESILKTNPNIDVIYAENDNMAFGAIDAIKAAGKTPGTDIKVISFDSTRAGLEATLAKTINLNVECNPLHGPRVKEIIAKLEKKETPEKIAYVDEAIFEATSITKEIVQGRDY